MADKAKTDSKEIEDGATIITLDYPITLNGVVVNEIKMRRPKVRDMKKARRFGDDPSEQEVGLFSILTGHTAEDLDEMDAVDYGQLQETFRKMQTRSAPVVAADGATGATVQDAAVGD